MVGGGKCRACIYKKAKLERDGGRERRERKQQRGLKVERAGTELHLCGLSSSETGMTIFIVMCAHTHTHTKPQICPFYGGLCVVYSAGVQFGRASCRE